MHRGISGSPSAGSHRLHSSACRGQEGLAGGPGDQAPGSPMHPLVREGELLPHSPLEVQTGVVINSEKLGIILTTQVPTALKRCIKSWLCNSGAVFPVATLN